jgi:outer membrane protein assembly factor BamA
MEGGGRGRSARRCWRVGLTAALLALGAGHAHAQNTECDAGGREVRSLRFRGNRAFTSSELALRIATTPSSIMRRTFRIAGTRRCLDSDELRLDVGRLRLFYRRHGYYAMAVDTSVSTLTNGSVRVRFDIVEGEPVRIDTLRITGLDSLTGPIADTDELDLRPGVVFDITRLQAAIDSIKSRLRDNGHPRADVAASYAVFDTIGRRARVSLEVLPGARARIGEIRVFDEPLPGAPRRLSDNTVRRLLGVRSGDEYSERELAAAQRALYQSDLFRHVEIGIAPDSAPRSTDSVVAIAVVLRENFVRQLDTEVGWAVLDCFKGRAQLVDKNFLGGARRLELTAQASKIGHADGTRFASGGLCAGALANDPFSSRLNYFVSGTFRFPTLFGLRGSPALSVYSERRGEYQAYLRTTLVGGEASLTREVRQLPLRLAYSLEFGRTEAQPALLCALFNRCDSESRALLTGRNRPLAVASAHLERLRTDNPFNPRSGTALRLDLRGAAKEIGSDRDLQFVKGLVDASVYRGLTRSMTFAARLRVGGVLSRSLSVGDSIRFVPPEERLYAGGAASVRGFQQNELGDLIYISEDDTVSTRGLGDTVYFEVPTGRRARRVVPVGGNSLVVANFEVRVKSFFYPELIQYTAFADAGDVWQRGRTVGARSHTLSRLFLDGLRWTPGVGVRVFTPVGPIQANVGYNPYLRPAGAIFFDAAPNEQGFAPLYCVSPGNRVPAVPLPNGQYEQISGSTCPATFSPSQSRNFFSRLTFTFSIGPDF